MSLSDQLTGLISRLARSAPAEHAGDSSLQKVLRKSALKPVNALVHMAIPFAGRAGFVVEVIGEGYLRARIPLKGNRNHMGSMYAGALFTLAEIPGGVMTIFDFGPAFVPILKSLEMTYLKPARSDVTVAFALSSSERDAILQAVKETGKAEFTLRGSLRDNKDEVVARSEAHYQVRLKSNLS